MNDELDVVGFSAILNPLRLGNVRLGIRLGVKLSVGKYHDRKVGTFFGGRKLTAASSETIATINTSMNDLLLGIVCFPKGETWKKRNFFSMLRVSVTSFRQFVEGQVRPDRDAQSQQFEFHETAKLVPLEPLGQNTAASGSSCETRKLLAASRQICPTFLANISTCRAMSW